MSKEKIKISDYHIVNEEKYDRAINGQMGDLGRLENGLVHKYKDKDVDEIPDGEKLAAYDRLGGLIRKDGRKVAMGSFYDFEKKKPREVPKVMLEFRDLEGGRELVPEGEAVPPELVAAEAMQKKRLIKKKKEAEKKAKELAEKKAQAEDARDANEK